MAPAQGQHSNSWGVPDFCSFRYEGEIKAFPDKQKLGGFIPARPELKEMKGALLHETKNTQVYKILSKMTNRSRKLQLLFRIGY